MDKFLTLTEASGFLREKGIVMQPVTLRKKAQHKEIPHYRMGKLLFKTSDLDKYIESKKVAVNRWPGRRR